MNLELNNLYSVSQNICQQTFLLKRKPTEHQKQLIKESVELLIISLASHNCQSELKDIERYAKKNQ